MILKGHRLRETPTAHIIGPAPKDNASNAGDDNCTYDERKVILVKLLLCIRQQTYSWSNSSSLSFCVKCDLYYQWNCQIVSWLIGRVGYCALTSRKCALVWESSLVTRVMLVWVPHLCTCVSVCATVRMRESGLWRICRVWESWWPQGVSGPWRSPAPNTTPSNPPPSFHTRVRKIFPKCAPKIPWKYFHFLLEIPTPISTHILPSPFLSLPTYTSAQIIHPEYSH